VVSLMYRRIRFVVWNRSHSEDINRSSIVVMPMYVQLVEFYNLMNISGTGFMQITLYGCTSTIRSTAPYLKLLQLKKYRFKRRTLTIISTALNDLKLQLYCSGYGIRL
jgi:hypothetical protein